MFIELHIIQNFAPSNLNRDETGAPKDCEFGGCRRARISSQCLKRAVRTDFKKNPDHKLGEDDIAVRSKRLRNKVDLVGLGRSAEESVNVASAAFGGLGILFGDDKGENKSEYLLFAGPAELVRFARVCNSDWDALQEAYEKVKEKVWEVKPPKKPSKDEAAKAVNKAVKDRLAQALDGGKAVDLALFGRMLADLPEKNIDAASQVAHAISTHKVSMEFDYYTAVDDLKPKDTAGADMIGTVEFNSACFYRYANVDLEQLKRNLVGKELDKATPDEHSEAEDMARQTVEAFLRASVAAVPTGKQNSMAAQNPPSVIFAVARKSGLWSLANAFVKPVPSQSGDLVQKSLLAMDEHWGRLTKMYGEKELAGKWLCALDGDGLTNLKGAEALNIDELVEKVMDAVKFEERKGGRK